MRVLALISMSKGSPGNKGQRGSFNCVIYIKPLRSMNKAHSDSVSSNGDKVASSFVTGNIKGSTDMQLLISGIIHMCTHVKMLKTNWYVFYIVGVPVSGQSSPAEACSSSTNQSGHLIIGVFTHLENMSAYRCKWKSTLERDFKATAWQVCLQNHALIERKQLIRGPVKPSSSRPKLAVVSIKPIRARFPNLPRFLFSGSESRRVDHLPPWPDSKDPNKRRREHTLTSCGVAVGEHLSADNPHQAQSAGSTLGFATQEKEGFTPPSTPVLL